MSDKKRLIRVKKEIKSRTPKFKRENYFRLKRLQTSWRSPKGINSKMRHRLKGKRKSPNIGYRGPKAVRGLHPLGKEVIRVQNLNELKEVNVDTEVAQLGRTVGSRKRIEMINYAEDNGIYIINPQVKKFDFGAEEDEFDLEPEIDEEFDDLALVDDEELDAVEEDE